MDSKRSDYRSPLPRLTSRVFVDLTIWMTGLGLAMGVVFPFFVLALGVPSHYVMTPQFFVATIGAGLVVGYVNQVLSSAVVRSRLRFMRHRMANVEVRLREFAESDDGVECTPDDCWIPVDSDDEIGEAASSFNRLVESLATSHRTTQTARRFAVTLSSHIEVDALVDAALREFAEATGAAAAALCVVSDGDVVVPSGSIGIVDPDALCDSDIVRRALAELQTVTYECDDGVRIDAGLVTFRPRSVMALPLHVRMVPTGVIVLGFTDAVREGTVELAQPLLQNLAIALNNALAHERLQRVAAIDSLTGVYNRRFGLERLAQEFSRSVRSQEPLGIALFDIDHFKGVNDTHGHEAGDVVLRSVAASVRDALREGDTLLRYGGEEFVAVLPGAGPADVEALAQRIRRVVEATVVQIGRVEVRVTVSVGAASFPASDIADLDELIARADVAMYDAKHAGRNRLVMASVG